MSKELGTRHRAAIGVTEESDAVVVVVSEETGTISASVGGDILRNLDGPSLRRHLAGIFAGTATASSGAPSHLSPVTEGK